MVWSWILLPHLTSRGSGTLRYLLYLRSAWALYRPDISIVLSSITLITSSPARMCLD